MRYPVIKNVINAVISMFLISIVTLSCVDDPFNDSNPKQFNPNVSEELATIVALNFSKSEEFIGNSASELGDVLFKSKGDSTFSGFEEKDIDEIIILSNEDDTPYIYVIKFTPAGFIIVSATKKDSPILGYSKDTSFDFENVPLGLAGWFVGRLYKIDVIKNDDNFEIPVEVSIKWNELAGDGHEWDEIPITIDDTQLVDWWTTTVQKAPLLETTWSQGNGYNDLVPALDEECEDYLNGKPPVGCVATAFAQVMRYHEYPNEYKWGEMELYEGSYETARLMRDIGHAVNMDYDCEVSIAKTYLGVFALPQHFGYLNTMIYFIYNIDLIIPELSENRPVVLSGSRTKKTRKWWQIFKPKYSYFNGHAWVTDGYKFATIKKEWSDGTVTERSFDYFLHMNWGWGKWGSQIHDGWYRHDDFTLSNGNNYQYVQKCIVGIQPPN